MIIQTRKYDERDEVNYPTPKGGGLQLDFSTAYGWLTTALQLSCSIEVSHYRVP